jgi:two-component system, chemotaxis family, sensor kinase CheA
MAQDPYKYFRPEAHDLVDQFAKGVLEIEKGGGSDVQKLLRLAHTLKGAARVVKQSEIANCAHAIEDTLSPFREDADKLGREQIDAVLEQLDAISDRLATLSPEPAIRGEAAPARRESDQGPRTVRTDIAETDAVLDSVAETHVLLNTLRGTAQRVEQARRLTDHLLSQVALPAGAPEAPRLNVNVNGRAAMVDELRRRFSGIGREFSTTIDQMDRELRQLRETAERLRLVPAEIVFTALERTARDAARALGKQVTFEGKGGSIRLDSHVLEIVQGALIQLVRNAVAHGIESEAERQGAGKPAAGSVCVEVTRRGRDIMFTCRDDGRGVDLEAIRRVAAERGLLKSGGQASNAGDLMQMLLRGGISTAQTVTAVSGRGIGLDVVREAIEKLGGKVQIDTKLGTGTAFELLLPPSLASMEALIVAIGGAGNAASIPLEAIRGALRITPQDISRSGANGTIAHGDAAIPFAALGTLLNGEAPSDARNWIVIVVAGPQGRAAIGVDRLLGIGRTVMRALPQGMQASAAVAGASLDAEGNPQLVLDPNGLVAAAHRSGVKSAATAAPKLPVLVVDDSMTTRMLEKSILESAGYSVELALSGEEGIELLRRKRVGMILVDVEMPGMDGFTFIERIRADSDLRETPAILVTSLASNEHIKRGRDVGANGHIVKSEFNQADLLAMIERLMRQ